MSIDSRTRGSEGAGTEPRSSQSPPGRIRLTSTVALSMTFVVIFSSAAIVAEVDYPRAAAEMPLVVCGFGALLSLLQLVVELRASRAGGEDAIDLARDVPMYLWVWAFVIGVVALGFVVAAPVMLFAYLYFRSRESWWLSLLLSLSVVAFLYGVFQVGMGVPLFDGLLTARIDSALTSANDTTSTTTSGQGGLAAAKAFFRGKTITYIVATSPGGGYDTYGRLVARYMNKYLPGTKIIVRNLPGAGHVIGADTIYAAKPDGLTIGTFNTGLIYMQLLQAPGVRFDLTKMSWIGKAAADPRVLVMSRKSGITNVRQLLDPSRPPTVLFAAGMGSAGYLDTRLAAVAIHLNVRLIPGYGGSEGTMSMLRGETVGTIGSESSYAQFVSQGQGSYLLQFGGPAGGPIPHAMPLATTPDARKLLGLIGAESEVSRLTAGPPGIPADRLELLRHVYLEALADPGFLAQARKMDAPVDPSGGRHVQEVIDHALQLPPSTLQLLRQAVRVGT
ncbi:MAG: tripartite tricarboxylate transporter substrate-binding protein [Steroidobacteraceae bacterium]